MVHNSFSDDDYLSCKVKFSKDMSKGWLGQPHMISSIQREFGEEIKGLRKYLTPGTPGARQVRADDPKMVIPAEKHARYRTVSACCFIWLSIHDQTLLIACVNYLRYRTGPLSFLIGKCFAVSNMF